MAVVLITVSDLGICFPSAFRSKAFRRSHFPGSGILAVPDVRSRVTHLFDPQNDPPYKAPFS